MSSKSSAEARVCYKLSFILHLLSGSLTQKNNNLRQVFNKCISESPKEDRWWHIWSAPHANNPWNSIFIKLPSSKQNFLHTKLITFISVFLLLFMSVCLKINRYSKFYPKKVIQIWGVCSVGHRNPFLCYWVAVLTIGGS